MRFKGLFPAAAAAALLGLAHAPAQAVELLQNGGFESGFAEGGGDFWSKGPADALSGGLISTTGATAFYLQSGQAVVLGPDSTLVEVAGDPYAINYRQREGAQFAVLMAGDQDVFTTVSQSFTVNGRARFRGFAAFLGRDYAEFDDSAYVKIFGPDSSETPLFSASIASLGDYGYTPWTSLLAVVEGDGVFTVEAGVVNRLDEENPSRLLLDGFSVTTSVPEPATWAFMIAGFGAAGAALRRRAAVRV